MIDLYVNMVYLIPQRMWRHVSEDENGCWIWNGAKKEGYGITIVRGRRRKAHRVFYESFRCRIENQIDHLCRVRNCVNPSMTHWQKAPPREPGVYWTRVNGGKPCATLLFKARWYFFEDEQAWTEAELIRLGHEWGPRVLPPGEDDSGDSMPTNEQLREALDRFVGVTDQMRGLDPDGLSRSEPGDERP